MKFAGKEPIEVLDDIKFILELRLLNNIKGIYINPENCPALTAEPPLAIDEMEVDKKSQMSMRSRKSVEFKNGQLRKYDSNYTNE